ncbi:MAG: hypothetical protein QM775_12385 [Pirellulales bacterium]
MPRRLRLATGKPTPPRSLSDSFYSLTPRREILTALFREIADLRPNYCRIAGSGELDMLRMPRYRGLHLAGGADLAAGFFSGAFLAGAGAGF